eukprot:gene16696-biopygen4720
MPSPGREQEHADDPFMGLHKHGLDLFSGRNVINLDSGREHTPRDMTSSENGHCYGGIDDRPTLASQKSVQGQKIDRKSVWSQKNDQTDFHPSMISYYLQNIGNEAAGWTR